MYGKSRFRTLQVIAENVPVNHIAKNYIIWATLLSQTVFIYFNHLDVTGSKSTEFGKNNRKITAITPFRVVQDHHFRHQSKARMQLPRLLVNNLYLISHRLQDIADY